MLEFYTFTNVAGAVSPVSFASKLWTITFFENSCTVLTGKLPPLCLYPHGLLHLSQFAVCRLILGPLLFYQSWKEEVCSICGKFLKFSSHPQPLAHVNSRQFAFLRLKVRLLHFYKNPQKPVSSICGKLLKIWANLRVF